MKLLRLRLKNFRGYSDLSFEPSVGLNVIEGENGSGKTNLVEAVYCLSRGKGWRSEDTKPLVKNGAEFAKIVAETTEGGIKTKVELVFAGNERRILVDEKPVKKLSELAKTVNVSLFTPNDTSLFVDSPKRRRNYLNSSISPLKVDYLESVCRYSKLLSERNAVLKGENPNPTQLDVINSEMASECAVILAHRSAFVSRLNEITSRLATALYGATRTLKIVYRPFVKGDDIEKSAKEAFDSSTQGDIVRKSTSIGPQREDFQTFLDGKEIGSYGSRGENRIAAIVLKIAPAFIEKDKNPIVILDDVYAELDEERSQNLSRIIKKMGQVFVTTTKANISDASYWEVSNHNATRRN